MSLLTRTSFVAVDRLTESQLREEQARLMQLLDAGKCTVTDARRLEAVRMALRSIIAQKGGYKIV